MIFIILLIIIFNIYLYCDDFEHYIINKEGVVTILLLGTIHGNEPAGSVALNEFIKEYTGNKKIKFIVVPTVNRCGKMLCMRNNILFDMNRQFTADAHNTGFNINKKIIKLIDQADFILDFHEGYDYHIINKKSIGSTLSPSNTDESYIVAKKILTKLNNSLITDPNKKFMILINQSNASNNNLINENPEIYSQESIIPKSLDYYVKNQTKKNNYILVETTGINNKQPLNIRTKQIKEIINTVIEYYS
jgi:hypothetical protein